MLMWAEYKLYMYGELLLLMRRPYERVAVGYTLRTLWGGVDETEYWIGGVGGKRVDRETFDAVLEATQAKEVVDVS